MTAPRRTRRAAAVWALALVLPLAGCSNPGHPLLKEDQAPRVRAIDLVSLEAQSTEPPVPLSAVALELTEEMQQLLERKRQQVVDAPERLELDVTEVRRAALDNNLDLRVERVQPAIARERVSEEEARFEATFFGSTSYNRAEVPGAPGNPTGPDLVQRSRQTELGVSIPLRTGGTAQVSLPVTGSDTRLLGGGAQGQEDYTGNLAVSVTQPLLRNAGVKVNTAPILVAQLQSRQQEARTKLAAIRILAAAETAYWEHYAASRTVEVRYEQYQRALEQERQARRLADAGVVPALEVTRASAGVSRRVEDVIVAETRRRQTQRNLKRVMNLPQVVMEGPTVLLPASEPDPYLLRLDPRATAEAAVGNRMEMLELELQLAVNDLTRDVAENQTLPVFGLDYRFAFVGRDSSFSRSIDRVFDRDFRDWQVGVSIQVPLGNQAARSRLRQAILERALTLSTRDQRRQAIEQEVYDVLDQLEQNWQRIIAARQETVLAARAFEGERKQFQAGVRTSTDVLQAADLLAEAQIREVQSLAAYEVAKVDTAFATGTLLGMGQIRLEPYGSSAPSPVSAGAVAVPGKSPDAGLEPLGEVGRRLSTRLGAVTPGGAP